MKISKSLITVALLVCIGIATFGNPVAGTLPKTAIFVDNYNYVTAYPTGSSGDVSPIALTTDMINPGGIARDATGRIYVSNTSTNTVTIYAAGSTGNVPPLAVIGGALTRLASPTAIALDASGKIYVLNIGTSAISVYPPLGAGTGILDEAPIAKIAGAKTLLHSPSALAVDARGDVYVANGRGGPTRPVEDYAPGVITVYSAGTDGNVAPSAVIKGKATKLTDPVGIALDGDGNIYVGNADAYVNRKVSLPASITGYSADASGDAPPAAIISGSNTNFDYPQGIAIDSAGNIYATGYLAALGFIVSSSAINVYPPGSNSNVSPSLVIAGADTGLSVPNAIAVDSDNNLYVSNNYPGSVTVYAAASTGDSVPITTITSRFNGIDQASGIAVDTAGKIYVPNRGSNSVAIYAAGTYGVSPPADTIAGVGTGLSDPYAIGLNASGNIAVLNGNGMLTEYPAGSIGDVSPTISFDATNGGLTNPVAVAIGPRGAVYVASQRGESCNPRGCVATGTENIAVYRPGSAKYPKPVAVISGFDTRLATPSAIAVGANGNIYVANQGPPACASGCSSSSTGASQTQDGDGHGSITVYASGSTGNIAPIATIEGPHTGLGYPQGIALDSSENLYVLGDEEGGDGFGGGGRAQQRISNLSSIADDNPLRDTTIGPVLVQDDSYGPPSILVFKAGSTGDAAPISIISGHFTALNGSGIAIGPTGQ